MDHSDDPLRFPRTLNKNKWENYLQRDLTNKEQMLFQNYKNERYMNQMIHNLREICTLNNLKIPLLTQNDGDCLFESLVYHNIGSSIISLRRGLSQIMFLFKKNKNFFPNQDSTLEELFNNINEIEYVLVTNRYKQKRVYKYNYDAMCQDMCNSSSWTRLPTELILMVISFIYQVEIKILTDSTDFIHTIKTCENSTKTIFLGHLGESHYLPVDHINENEYMTEPEKLVYNDAYNFFLKWAQCMEENVRKQKS